MESLEDRESVISVRIQMLAAALSKKCPDELIAVYQRNLSRFPISVLTKAFGRAESELERFPPPRILAGFCQESMPSEMWRYNFKPGYDDDGVPCLIDPDPWCDVCHYPSSEHPTKNCAIPVDRLNARFMYRPQDCAEGRGFLAKLKELAEAP